MSMIVYHGGTDKIEYPLSDVGRANLDFGIGFYVTGMLSQAGEWAKKVADHRQQKNKIENNKTESIILTYNAH